MIPYDELPAGRLRDAARAALARGDTRPVTPAPRARPASLPRARNRYRCTRCNAVETSVRAIERHVDAEGGGRYDLELEAVS